MHTYLLTFICYNVGMASQGYCEVLQNDRVNELKLDYLKPEPENLMTELYEKPQESSHSRRRRDLNYVVPTETTEKGGKRERLL